MHPVLVAVRAALAGGPVAAGSPPDPWHAWLLVVLARQVDRQRWLVRVQRMHLPEDTGEDTGEGEVPGMPGWRFCFHGDGLCLTAPDGEMIDVDDHGDGGLTIDPYFFAQRIRSLARPALPEERLRAFLPAADAMVAAIRELTAEGLLVPARGGHVFRVLPELEESAGALASIDFSDAELRARWAEHLGDLELLALERPSAAARTRATAQRAAFKDYLLERIAREATARAFIEPLEAVLTPAELVDTCAGLIDAAVNATSGHAIERLDAHPDYPVCPAVSRLLARADPAVHHPYAVHAAARYLLRRGIERDRAVEAVLAFASVRVVAGYKGNPFLGELALLLLEHAPQHALDALRRALRSSTPAVRTDVAGALAALGQPWCVRELLLALGNASTFEASASVRAALSWIGSDEARAALLRWTQTHVLRVTEGPGYGWEEVQEANADGFLAREIEERRAWADAVRPAIDPDFDRVVWG
ncbi:HEAT repeat domain-containing protein [Sorangium sp. So ce1097]|uniref:HEAT repeat domain-containing protein n=1 Tax=Sorangium sp. So ce1097 TaxID=3133330 RepID=UPI003F5E2FA9